MQKIFLSLLLLITSSFSICATEKENTDSNYNRTTFYVQAHQDDWQLFRGEQGYSDIKDPKNKVVFIYTTAGDGGLTYDGKWAQAREAGALNSITGILPGGTLNQDSQIFNNRKINRYNYLNTVSYFMRLPDGNIDGSGYAATDYQSLKNLNQKGQPITAIDTSASYSNWKDFRNTLASIVSYEDQPCSDLKNFGASWINVSNYNLPVDSASDHADHHYTSLAVQKITNHNVALYDTYIIKTKAPNLSDDALKHKTAVYGAYKSKLLSKLQDFGIDTQQINAACEQEIGDWIPRSYFTEVFNCRIKSYSTGAVLDDNGGTVGPDNKIITNVGLQNNIYNENDPHRTWILYKVNKLGGYRIKSSSTGAVLDDNGGAVSPNNQIITLVGLQNDIYNENDPHRTWIISKANEDGGYKIKSSSTGAVLDDNNGTVGPNNQIITYAGLQNDIDNQNVAHRIWVLF